MSKRRFEIEKEVEESPNNTAIYEVKGGCNCGK